MLVNDIPKYMAISLIVTIIVEELVGIIIGIRNKKDLLNVLLVNIMTNPIVVSSSIAINLLISLKVRNISLIFLEAFAVISEALIYKKYLDYKKINPFIVSLILNFCSFIIGFIIY